MRFQSLAKHGNLHSVGGRTLTFIGGFYETDDKTEIALLEKCNDVVKVETRVRKKEEAPE
jgi:hypothetical protein